jgi:3-hydroxyisobutyrate dehydrogenase-like beta-hydroxyacid dehydrogenase
MGMTPNRIALIGYGEVGRILAEDLRAAGHAVQAYDVLFDSDAGESMRLHAHAHGVAPTSGHTEAVRDAELVISVVTASQALPAAAACAGGLVRGAFLLDFNSASPRAKIACAERVERSGGRYVEGAVMTSVPPHRIKVPLLIGGPHALASEPMLTRLGFAPRLASAELGVASATKMCRSVMIKGLEAMLIESFTAARHYGVEAELIASLGETLPAIDWERQAAYFFQRVIAHGRRRAEEMREAAATVRDAGLEPWSALATAARQSWVADLAEQEVFGCGAEAASARSADWRAEADRILRRIAAPRRW